MKKIWTWMGLLAVLFFVTLPAKAQGSALELYHLSLEDELAGDAEQLDEIRAEIAGQAQAVLEANGLPTVNPLASFSTRDSVRVAVAEQGETGIIEQLESVRSVIDRRIHVKTEDIFQSRFLKYVWKVPVGETGNGYLYASVKMNGPDDVSIWTTLTGDRQLSDVTYLFDQDLVSNILESSGLPVNYDIVLPISIPMISTDVIVFAADKTQYAIPFSARPDLLGVENGKIYEYSQIEEKINDLMYEISPEDAVDGPVGGGVWVKEEESNGLSDGQWRAAGIVLLLLGGTYAGRKLWKSRKRAIK